MASADMMPDQRREPSDRGGRVCTRRRLVQWKPLDLRAAAEERQQRSVASRHSSSVAGHTSPDHRLERPTPKQATSNPPSNGKQSPLSLQTRKRRATYDLALISTRLTSPIARPQNEQRRGRRQARFNERTWRPAASPVAIPTAASDSDPPTIHADARGRRSPQR
jgi:hypothetical protein